MSNQVYHNAFYYKASELKYKKDTQSSGNFYLSSNRNGLNLCTSYSTDVAIIDTDAKIMVMTSHRYSVTTTKQLRQLWQAAPGDFVTLTAPLDESNYYYMSADELKKTVTKIYADAVAYITGHKMRVTDSEFWRHLDNLQNSSDSEHKKLYNYYKREQREYRAKLWEKQQERVRVAVERRKAKIDAFNAAIADGMPAPLARHKFKYVEPAVAPMTWGESARDGFIWSGKPDAKIKTTKGVEFTPQTAAAFKNYKQWRPGDRVMLYHVERVEPDWVKVGCHQFNFTELQALCDMAAKIGL